MGESPESLLLNHRARMQFLEYFRTQAKLKVYFYDRKKKALVSKSVVTHCIRLTEVEPNNLLLLCVINIIIFVIMHNYYNYYNYYVSRY